MEKDKMLRGDLYNAEDEQLMKERMFCKKLCHEFNQLSPDNVKKKKEIIKKLFKSTKNEFHIEPSFWCDYGYNIEIGENFYANHNLVILDPAPVKFGDNVFIGPNCGFYTAGHPLDPMPRNNKLEFATPITVGNNVWIGGNVTVLPGVNIGNNVVVGAGSVVVRNISDNSIVVGNPVKVLKNLDN